MLETKSAYAHFFPSTFTLETQRVLLRLLQPEDVGQLLLLPKTADTFRYFTKDLTGEQELKNWVAVAVQERMQQTRMPFIIVDKDNYEIAGTTSYGSFSFYDKRVEIGWTWLGTPFAGTGLNRHAKFAMLSYAFEVMKMERVEAKTDNLNERARAALLKVGMKPEGVLRSHMQMHSNRRRDSIYFSLLREEWPERKQQFFSDMF